MTLEKLSKTVDFVQATTPSNANDGETYLDTSQSPPQLKVFDSSANAFVRPRSIQNLDAPVSNAGATQSDIETAVDNSNTASTVSNNLDAPISSRATQSDILSDGTAFDGANIDAKISQAGDLRGSNYIEKPYTKVEHTLPPGDSGTETYELLNVSGSGIFYPQTSVLWGKLIGNFKASGSGTVYYNIDGTNRKLREWSTSANVTTFKKLISGPIPFNSSFKITVDLYQNNTSSFDRTVGFAIAGSTENPKFEIVGYIIQ